MNQMISCDFYEEINLLSDLPSSFNDLKEKILKLFNIANEQKEHILISYFNEDNERIYILNDIDLIDFIPVSESFILNIELTDKDHFLMDEEKPVNLYQKFLPPFPKKVIKRKKKENKIEKNEKNENIEEVSYYVDINDEEYTNYEYEYGENEIEEIDIDYKKNISENKIKCNNCNVDEIKGIRYLCGYCSNFNLCYECEKKVGKEHGHPLLKIRNNSLAPISFSCELFDNNRK